MLKLNIYKKSCRNLVKTKGKQKALGAFLFKAIERSFVFDSYFSEFFRLSFLFVRSEEHTSELQSLMSISYAVLCLKTKIKTLNKTHNINTKLISNHPIIPKLKYHTNTTNIIL